MLRTFAQFGLICMSIFSFSAPVYAQTIEDLNVSVARHFQIRRSQNPEEIERSKVFKALFALQYLTDRGIAVPGKDMILSILNFQGAAVNNLAHVIGRAEEATTYRETLSCIVEGFREVRSLQSFEEARELVCEDLPRCPTCALFNEKIMRECRNSEPLPRCPGSALVSRVY